MEGVPSFAPSVNPEPAHQNDQRIELEQSPVTMDQTMDATHGAPSADLQAPTVPEGLPQALPAASEGATQQDADTVTTRLTVRPSLSSDKLDKFRDTLQSMPGVRQATVANTTADSTNLHVTHAVDSSLLGNLLAIDGLDFRLIGRGEGTLEVEIF